MNRDLKEHKVQVLHKCTKSGELAAGMTFRFRSGAGYQVQLDGSLRAEKFNLTKAQRKQNKRARRLARMLSNVNVTRA